MLSCDRRATTMQPVARLVRLPCVMLAAMLLVLGASVSSAQPGSGTPIGKPLPRQPGRGAPVDPDFSGPPPVGVTITGTPATTTVAWAYDASIQNYDIKRWKQDDPACCRMTMISSLTAWVDDGQQFPGVYVYRVTAVYKNGTRGSVQHDFARPAPSNPIYFSAAMNGTDAVTLSWSAVPDASFYVVWGDGLAGIGSFPTTATVIGVQGLRVGPRSWTVGAFFNPGPISTVATAFTKTSLYIQFPKP